MSALSSPSPAVTRSSVETAVPRGLLGALLANDWAVAGGIFAVTRTVALVGGYFGAREVIQVETFRDKGWMAELSLNWDAAWYAGIALNGYNWHPGAAGGTNIAFPPLYPFLIDALATLLEWVTFGWDWGHPLYGRLIAAGLMVSNVSFLVALVFLMRLLTPRLGRNGAALVALGMASLPLSFFFSAIYTEGLFLMLVLGSLLVARSDWSGKWAAAGALGMAASLVKFHGALVLPMLAAEYLSQRGWSLRRVRPDVLWLGLVPMGVALYMAYLWWQFGTPFALLDTMYKGWGHERSFFLSTYWDDGVVLLWRSVTRAVPPEADWVLIHGSGNRLYAFLDVFMPLILLVGAIAAYKKLLAAEWAWLLLGILYPLSAGTTNSLARYMLPLWPGLIWLGMVPHRWRWLAGVLVVLSWGLLFWCARIYGTAKWIG